MMATSQNGWPASPSLARRPLIVDGVEFVGGIVDNADVETLFAYVLGRFHREVEPLVNPGCWGFSYRENRNDPTSLSNHSSGTAVDANAPQHPNAVPTARTFTPAQIATVHAILADLDGVVRWGGDYQNTPDAMHFEINDTPVRVAIVAARLRRAQEDDMQLSDKIYPNKADSPTVGQVLRRMDRFMARQDSRQKQVLEEIDALPEAATKQEVRRIVAKAFAADAAAES